MKKTKRQKTRTLTLKIQKKQQKTRMQVFPAKRRDENCTGKYSKGLSDSINTNQNEKHLVNLCEWY